MPAHDYQRAKRDALITIASHGAPIPERIYFEHQLSHFGIRMRRGKQWAFARIPWNADPEVMLQLITSTITGMLTPS